LASQVTDRLTPAYEKQRIAVHQIGNEIQNQIRNLDYEMGVLLDQAGARALSVEEQERLNLLVDEINTLEELGAENRIAEINEMTALRDEAYQNRLDQIQTEKDDELQAQQEVIDKYMEKVDVISGLGDTIFQTFDAINEAITTVQQNEIDEMTKSVEEQQKAIDKMVKDGVMGASEAAERKASIEKGLQNQIQEMKLKEFQRERASSLAQIAFGLAKGIAQSLALPPVVRGATIATLTALAGAQTAVVTAQQPPKFDVGGMVGQSDGGPDVVNANLLRGEAVLDRATVDRLGGESGVQQLQNGGGVGSQVVIIQPFKHIDRYNRARSKRMATRVGSGGY
jgi:ribosomal protein S20